MKVSRRMFLAGGAAGAALLAVGGGLGLYLRGTVLREPRQPLQVLDVPSFSILAAVADRVAPGDAELPSAWDVRVAEKVDATLASMHPADAAELAQALGLIENALVGLVFEGRFTTFTGSSPETQDAILASWRASGLQLKRAACKALVGLCSAAYWGSPEVYTRIGYVKRDYGQTRLAPEDVAWTSNRYLPPGAQPAVEPTSDEPAGEEG